MDRCNYFYKNNISQLILVKEIEMMLTLTQDRLWRKNRNPTFIPACIGLHSLRNIRN